MGKKKEILEAANKAFEAITDFNTKYGVKNGEREPNKELFWYEESPKNYEKDSAKNTGFVIKNIARSELIYTGLIEQLKMLNRTAFGDCWEGGDATKWFKDRVESLLWGGHVAAFKHPVTGDLILTSFSHNPDNINVATGVPTEITIISNKESLSGLVLKQGSFEIGYNSSSKTSELAYDLPGIEMAVNAIMGLALVIRKSKPKTLITGFDDDTLASDTKRAIESDEWIEFLNIGAKQLAQLDIRFESGFKDRMEMVIGSISNLMKNKGWNTGGLLLKRERQSESELENDNHFKHFLIQNKTDERLDFAERVSSTFGVDIAYNPEELIDSLKGGDSQSEEKTGKTEEE